MNLNIILTFEKSKVFLSQYGTKIIWLGFLGFIAVGAYLTAAQSRYEASVTIQLARYLNDSNNEELVAPASALISILKQHHYKDIMDSSFCDFEGQIKAEPIDKISVTQMTDVPYYVKVTINGTGKSLGVCMNKVINLILRVNNEMSASKVDYTEKILSNYKKEYVDLLGNRESHKTMLCDSVVAERGNYIFQKIDRANNYLASVRSMKAVAINEILVAPANPNKLASLVGGFMLGIIVGMFLFLLYNLLRK